MSETTFTPGPWEYIPGTEHHGPYVSGPYGGDICDCYAMSNPLALSVRNGGDSKPIWHQAERADANARLIAAAPALYEALSEIDALPVQELSAGVDSTMRPVTYMAYSAYEVQRIVRSALLLSNTGGTGNG